MIKEYALDPELLTNWKDFRFFTTFFSLENGRALSGYPSPTYWISLVRKNLSNCKPMEKAKILEGLHKLVFIHSRDNGKWNDKSNWLDNIIEEDKRKPFQAIISNKNTKHPTVILGDQIICSQLLPDNSKDLTITKIKTLFKTPRSVIVNRKPKEMALCIKDLLQSSKQFIFIDPYFLATASNTIDLGSRTLKDQNERNIKRHIRPLKEFLEIISDSNKDNSLPITRLQYHSKNTDKFVDDNTFKLNCDKELPSLIPKGKPFDLMRWNDESLHNRYILTDIGGVMFGTGLDDNDEGDTTKADKDVVTLLDEDTRQQLWQQYASQKPLHTVKGRK